MDVAHLPWTADGYRYFVVIVDLFTRYVELVPVANQCADTICSAFLHGWVFKHGVPYSLLTDQAHNVDGNTVRELCERYQIEKKHSSPHHPEGDGLVERTVQTVKQKLRCLLADRKLSQEKWPDLLLEVSFLMNATPNASTKIAPHEQYFGSKLRPPIDVELLAVDREVHTTPGENIEKLVDEANYNLKKAQGRMKAAYDVGKASSDIESGDFVLVDNRYRKSGLDSTFIGPYRVLQRNKCNVTILDGGRARVIHLNRCKRYRSPTESVTPCSVEPAPEPGEQIEPREENGTYQHPTSDQQSAAYARQPSTSTDRLADEEPSRRSSRRGFPNRLPDFEYH